MELNEVIAAHKQVSALTAGAEAHIHIIRMIDKGASLKEVMVHCGSMLDASSKSIGLLEKKINNK